MRQPWASVDRWGPIVVALLTLLGVVAREIQQGQRISRNEGLLVGLQRQIDQRNQLEVALRSEVETWKAYVVTLKGEMAKAGVPTPPPPRPKEQ